MALLSLCRCGKEFASFPSDKKKNCSKECMYKFRRSYKGDQNPAWRGGKTILTNGYTVVWSPDHPYAAKGKNPWVYEHRLVMEDYLGRILEPQEVVHHINHERSDNRIENLMLFPTHSEHVKYHNQEDDKPAR